MEAASPSTRAALFFLVFRRSGDSFSLSFIVIKRGKRKRQRETRPRERRLEFSGPRSRGLPGPSPLFVPRGQTRRPKKPKKPKHPKFLPHLKDQKNKKKQRFRGKLLEAASPSTRAAFFIFQAFQSIVCVFFSKRASPRTIA